PKVTLSSKSDIVIADAATPGALAANGLAPAPATSPDKAAAVDKDTVLGTAGTINVNCNPVTWEATKKVTEDLDLVKAQAG
ncbi:hypothetical protein QN401_28870, partial [Pseudomonas sp. 5S3]|nr:hypothetical protein [Pseudomonas sp. 5S3]